MKLTSREGKAQQAFHKPCSSNSKTPRSWCYQTCHSPSSCRRWPAGWSWTPHRRQTGSGDSSGQAGSRTRRPWTRAGRATGRRRRGTWASWLSGVSRRVVRLLICRWAWRRSLHPCTSRRASGSRSFSPCATRRGPTASLPTGATVDTWNYRRKNTTILN